MSTSVPSIKGNIQPILQKETERLKQQKILSQGLAYLVFWCLALLICYQSLRWVYNAYHKFPLIYDKELKAHQSKQSLWLDWCHDIKATPQDIALRKQSDDCINAEEYIRTFVIARAIGSFLVSEINDKLGFIVGPIVSCGSNWICSFAVGFWIAERIGKDWIFPLLSSLIMAITVVISRYGWRYISNTMQKRKNVLDADLPRPANSKVRLD
jgi:hypothetical protein